MGASDLINYIRDKSVLILGFGREGRSTYNFIRSRLPEKPLTIGDVNPVKVDDPLVEYDCGEGYLDHLGKYDVVFKTPGIAFLGVNYPDSTEITCQTDMFMRFCDCRVIGVTGTKGKTTTSTLTYEILKAAGKKTSLIGNMGLPVLDHVDMGADEIAVIEMSSHQLEFTRSSPDVAVLTNIFEEHLDHYEGGMAGYVNAKLNIVRYQTVADTFIYNETQGVSPWLDLAAVPSKKTAVPLGGSMEDLPKSKNLPGEHYRQDIEYAYRAASVFGADREALRTAVENYRGIEHRLERFGDYGGVIWYDDAISTMPFSTECGIRAVSDEVCPVGTLIIGGLDRTISYDEFEDYLAASDIGNIICLPETGHKIADALLARKDTKPAGKGVSAETTEKSIDKPKGMTTVKPAVYKAADMEEAVALAVKHTRPGTACILSPSAASYNVYKNFEEKGRHFKELVRKTFGEN